MNIGKSTKICLAKTEHNTAWLADQLGITTARVSAIVSAEHHNTATIDKLAKAFGLSVSEFIALGEDA
jgi:plasmid maintenance system antidote protein VapI